MTLRPADLRFVLPRAPRRAVVRLPELADAFEQAGVTLVNTTEAYDGADLVVTGAASLRATDVEHARALLVPRAPARARKQLRRAGFGLRDLLVREGPEGPRVVAPVDGPALGWVLLRWGRPHDLGRIARNAMAFGALKTGAPMSTVTLATRDAGAPYPLDGAAPFGLRASDAWVFVPGAGDELQRAVFHVFAAGERAPRWVVKLSRRAGNDEPFDADARALDLARGAGTVVQAHAPRLLGRYLVDDLPASVETSAPGRPLYDLLRSPGRRAGKDRLIDGIAQWFVDVACATAGAPATLDAERARLAALPGGADLVGQLPAVPGVLAHLDPGTWNIISDGATFTLIDWEAARRPALPLWDLLYFLADALSVVDGARDTEDALRHDLALFRGEHRASPALFAHVRTYARAAGLPREAIGPLATLGWLHHGRSHLHRNAALGRYDTELAPVELNHLARIIEPWMADARLGPRWVAFAA